MAARREADLWIIEVTDTHFDVVGTCEVLNHRRAERRP